MVRRRWPDVVITIAVVLLGCAGIWAIWGHDLGLRGGGKGKDEPPVRQVESGGGMT